MKLWMLIAVFVVSGTLSVAAEKGKHSGGHAGGKNPAKKLGHLGAGAGDAIGKLKQMIINACHMGQGQGPGPGQGQDGFNLPGQGGRIGYPHMPGQPQQPFGLPVNRHPQQRDELDTADGLLND